MDKPRLKKSWSSESRINEGRRKSVGMLGIIRDCNLFIINELFIHNK